MRDRAENTPVVDDGVLATDNTDAVTYTMESRYHELWIENLTLEPIMIRPSQNTAGGTIGKPLAPCQDDGTGSPVLGTGGAVVIDRFCDGDVYFYSANPASVYYCLTEAAGVS